MKRIRDVIVGLFMVFAGLLAQFIFIGIFVGLLLAAFVPDEKLIWLIQIGCFVVLNLLIFWEFRRRVRVARTINLGQMMFLLPRGFCRIRYGREFFRRDEVVERGFEVVPVSHFDPKHKF